MVEVVEDQLAIAHQVEMEMTVSLALPLLVVLIYKQKVVVEQLVLLAAIIIV